MWIPVRVSKRVETRIQSPILIQSESKRLWNGRRLSFGHHAGAPRRICTLILPYSPGSYPCKTEGSANEKHVRDCSGRAVDDVVGRNGGRTSSRCCAWRIVWRCGVRPHRCCRRRGGRLYSGSIDISFLATIEQRTSCAQTCQTRSTRLCERRPASHEKRGHANGGSGCGGITKGNDCSTTACARLRVSA
jgi:hypothetical protein